MECKTRTKIQVKAWCYLLSKTIITEIVKYTNIYNNIVKGSQSARKHLAIFKKKP